MNINKMIVLVVVVDGRNKRFYNSRVTTNKSLDTCGCLLLILATMVLIVSQQTLFCIIDSVYVYCYNNHYLFF